MLSKYIVGINWVDFLIIGIVIRMCYIGLRTGIGVELFKLFSLWLAVTITMQTYAIPLSDLLHAKLPPLPLEASDVFVFVVLVALITIMFRIIRESFFLLVKIEAHNTLDRWGGMVFGCLRGFLAASLVLFIMIISTVQYLEISAKSSLFGQNIINIAPQVYEGSYEGLISKFFAQTQLNQEIFKAIER